MDEVQIQEDSFSSDEDFDDVDEEDDYDSDSSSNVDEILEKEEIFDKDFLRCYSALKRKDVKIYDKNVRFFNDKEHQDSEITEDPEDESIINKKWNKPKMTILDHQLSLKDEVMDEPRSSRDDDHVVERTEPMLSHYERELDELKKEITMAANSDTDDDDGDDGFLIRKDAKEGHTKSRLSKKDKIESIPDDGDKDIQKLKTLWSDPKNLTEEDRFLRDYIVNKRYIPPKKDNADGGFFSKDIDQLSDADDDEEEEAKKKKSRKTVPKYHSEEPNFDAIARIPRNATQTIRDLNEKKLKKEKRLRKIEKRKKIKKDLGLEEFSYMQTQPDEKELNNIMKEIELDIKSVNEKQSEDVPEVKKKKKKKRGGQKKAKSGVAPDRLLSYGLSKTKLRKSKLL